MTRKYRFNDELLLMQAFQELQAKIVSTTQQVKIADFQIEQLKRQIVHAKLVEKEIDTLPKDVRTYEGVGRMQVSRLLLIRFLEFSRLGLGCPGKTFGACKLLLQFFCRSDAVAVIRLAASKPEGTV